MIASRRVRSTACAAAVLLVAAALCCGEGTTLPMQPIGGAGGSGGAATTTSSSSGSSSTSSSTPSCPELPRPESVPEGWVKWDDWSCDCQYYVPGSKEVLPPPIEWEDCPDTGSGIVCRAMKTPWAVDGAPITYMASMDLGPSGEPLLAFTRSGGEPMRNTFLVAEPDGQVHTAFLWAMTGSSLDEGCVFRNDSFNEGRIGLLLWGIHHKGPPSWDTGLAGGPMDALAPTVVYRTNTGGKMLEDYAVGQYYVARLSLGAARVHPWTMGKEWLAYNAPDDPENLPLSRVQFVGDTLFVSVHSYTRAGINVWDPAHGPRPFIRWVGDATRGAGDFGTDGVDMVWSYGEGKEPSAEVFPTRSIMTAPYANDPAAVMPQRLRSLPGDSLVVEPWRVGCGYAAHTSDTTEVLVVRLSDGWAWRVPNGPGLLLGVALGLTCEELFVAGSVNKLFTIARVRLDSLGPGEPPD
jgi:hypothetical protein